MTNNEYKHTLEEHPLPKEKGWVNAWKTADSKNKEYSSTEDSSWICDDFGCRFRKEAVHEK